MVFTLSEKRGQSVLISILTLLVGSILFVGAVVTNSTNETINETPLTNLTLLLNETVNLTGPVENIINESINLSLDASNKISVLAKVFNEDNLDFDREYKRKYLDLRNNFSEITFSNITSDVSYTLKVGAKNDKLRAIKINDNNFVIDLLYCKLQGRYCAFRVNGVPAARLHSFEEFGSDRINSFDIDGNYVLKVNSVKFNQCDNHRFCHLGYEGYHLVDVSIEGKE